MKKIFALVLTVAMLATMSVVSFATNTVEPDTEDKAPDTTVQLNVDPTYIITIPATITLVEDVEAEECESEFTISAAEDLRLLKGKKITVTVDGDYTMTTGENAELAYEIKDEDKANVLNDEVVATFVTSRDAQSTTLYAVAGRPEYAGNYSDTVTFTIAVADVTPAA